MTCIVGLVDGGTVWIGADSYAAAGCQRYPMGEEQKVFRRGDFIFATAGVARLGQIIRHLVELPEPSDEPPMAYLVRRLMPAIKTAIDQYGGAGLGTDEWALLIAYRGKLWDVDDHLAVDEVTDYAAIGCGRPYATGSLYSTRPPLTGCDAIARINLALRAAAAHDVHVAPPFIIERLV